MLVCGVWIAEVRRGIGPSLFSDFSWIWEDFSWGDWGGCNLKKVLTLVLTVAMLLSVMVVGTGAAFSDQDSIKNKEAVDVCTTLNIIAGMEDGSYRPANNVTRAQMCKMICVALNGGKEPTLGTDRKSVV